MPFSQAITEELNILAMFNLETTQEGIKIHSTAEDSVIAAAQRLFDKGLTTQPDGGYLTERGRRASMHAQDLLSILKE